MKKISVWLMTIALFCVCMLFSACNPTNKASITFDKTNATIYLGESENNQVSILATVKNANVNKLEMVYDTSFISISQNKNTDGTFTIVVKSLIDYGTKPIAVEVKAGDKASAVFYVDIVLPLQNIVAKENAYISYNGLQTTYNLNKFISFEPEGTIQTGVEYSLVEESDYVHIENNSLILDAGLNVSELKQVRVNAVSTVDASISTELNLKLVPTADLLADNFSVMVDYDGEKTQIQNKTYELTIKKEETGYTLSKFVVEITIPQSLGIEVDLDSSSAGGLSTNILNYLSYSKSHLIDANTSTNIKDVYTFTFSAKSSLQGVGDLRFKYWYKDYASDNSLTSLFVAKIDGELVKKIQVIATMPVTHIDVQTDCSLNTETNIYTIFSNYSNIYGEAFTFVAMPYGTSQNVIVLEKPEDSNLRIYNSKGNLLTFGRNIYDENNEIVETKNNQLEINSGETIYVVGGEKTSETLTYFSSAEGKADKTRKTLSFSVVKGTSALGFVESIDSLIIKTEVSLYAEVGNSTTELIYAPDTKSDDFIKDASIVIEPNLEKENYYNVTFTALRLGKHTYTIRTINGYSITANLTVIQPLENAILTMKNNSGFVAGVGDYAPKNDNNSDLVNISIQNGYSVELAYNINKNAQIAKIKYSFYNPLNIDVYGEEIALLKDVYNYAVPTALDELSLILNNQNLAQSNILTGVKAGVNIVKIEIYGQKVVKGNLVEEVAFTKYLFVQVYNPVKQITSTAKNITLRALDQVAPSYESLTTKTLSLNVLSNADEVATYNKIYIEGGKVQTILGENEEPELVCTRTISSDGIKAIEIVYSYATGKLTIRANHFAEFETKPIIKLFAVDFRNITGNAYSDSDITCTYIININLIETKAITDISVSNLTLDEDKSDATTKVYNTIYIDTSKSESITYKLYTDITPSDAFDKALKFTFTPNSGSTQAMLDISSDGVITILGSQGGTGVITIEPLNARDGITVKTIKIPIVVSDGNSWETAYEITSLDEIKFSNKHYVLTIPTTYTLNKTLFESLESGFSGGLYGRRFGDTSSAKATIKLDGVSLFNVLANNAYVADLNICGDVTQTSYTKDGENVIFTSRGFVANVNKGTIDNVKVTSYIKNGTYVPSLLTVGANVTAVGGIAGTNTGVIKNCTFAGSINITNNASLQAKAITNNDGTVENCKVIIAKYQSEIISLRLVNDGENYVNGVVGGTQFADIDNNLVKEENYKDYSFDGNVWIKDYSNDILNHSYGEEDNNYGLIFYYQAKDASKQSLLNKYNVIALSDLLGLKNTSLTCDNLKVMAMLSDNSQCSFVSVDSQSLTINGIGEFVLSISSEYDYTQVSKLNVLAINHANEFSLSGNGVILNNTSELELVYGQKYEIISKLNNIVTIVKNDGRYETIELVQNDFDLAFTISYDGALEEINASDYITGTKLGSHTVNMIFDWNNSTKVQVKLISGFDVKYDLLINKFFELSESVNSEFSLKKRNGTTEITTNIADGSIEPKDTFTFTATLITDLSTDIIDNNSIEIYSQENINLTEFGYFDIFAEKDVTIENTFRIQVSVNQDKIREAGYNLLDFVSKTYTIKVKAKNVMGIDEKIYDASTNVALRLLPQTVADINTVLYNVTTSNTSGINVSNGEAPTSVLIPSGNGGLFVINMFPAYASYDYIDVVATANTISKLSFRLQERIVDGEEVTNNYKNASVGYEPLYGQNGIRLLNNNTKDNQNIGTYYLKVFADASFSGDTIFTITVNAYYKNEEVTAQSVFTLFMRMPEAPQVSLNGETKVYTLAGKTIEDIEVLIASDQINPIATIASDFNGDSVIDGKSTNKIHCTMSQVSDNALVGYRKYKITVTFDEDYVENLSTNSTQFKIVVTSVKISNGLEIPVSSEMYIYVVDYKTNSDDIRIFNASEDKFKVTSLKYVELKLADLLAEEVSATQEFIDLFNENYYFANENTGFTFGKNKYSNGETEIELSRPQILASYLSYVKGNTKSPLLKVDNDNNLQLISNEYVTFDFKDGKLMVKGGNYTGSVSMILEIEYKMPDGKIVTYEYRFEIVNSLYTTEDLPKEVATVESFLDMVNSEDAQDYILTSDLYLYDYKTISDTSKIASLDGNNHTIHIINYLEDESSTGFALFNNVTSNTTIKNLTVNLYHLKQIVVGDSIKNIQIAGFALQNDGAIYNCEVVAYNNNALPTMSTTFGIKVDENIDSEIAGFVLTNNGSITNSRFGGTSKLTTNIDYVTDKNNIVVDRKVIEKTYATEMLSIVASGTLSGFVGTNNGVIASSFVKNANIKNTYNKLETKVTAGFVGTNNGTIAMSYTEGGFEKETDIRATLGGLEGTGIMAGFVYLNAGKITDSYSNISISNNKEQAGRLGAGFVYENADSGIIERCYSASKITSNNISQMNFAGIKDFGGYNNAGQIKTSYYYIENTVDEISIESVLGTSITAIVDVSNKQNLYGFNFASSDYVGTWQMSEKGVRPELVSANDIAHSVRAKYENANNVTGNANVEYLFVYCDAYILGSKNNPIIIRDAKEFNAVFGDSSSTDISNVYDLTSAKVYGTYRLVNNVDMLDLVPKEEQDTEYKVNLVSTKMTLTGKYTNSSNMAGSINGNGLTIKNLAISNSSSTSEGFGLFKSLEDGAGIANLNIELAEGGVSADHTVYVGTIAGTLENSYANNITIKGTSANEYTKVVGANITGGMFGRVIGDSGVSNCTIENISVTSTYNKAVSINNDNVQTINVYEREKENTFSTLSISGGAFGVVDVYTTELRDNTTTYSSIADTTSPTLASIAVKGGLLVEGMTAGGVAGFIGNYVIARDISLTIYKDAVQSGIIAYSCYAGAIAGFSRGYLYQVKAEHEQEWQDEIESNIQSYYTAQDDDSREQVDRGVTNLFESELSYSPFAVGGLIGVQQSGKLSIAYSKLNVENKNAKSIGGVVGFITEAIIVPTTSTSSTDLKIDDMSFIMHETYAVGNVYSANTNAKIGGVIGYNKDDSLKITKVNAMNYWSKDSYDLFGTDVIDSIGFDESEKFSQETAYPHLYSIGQIRFSDGESEGKDIFESNEVMKNYYSYSGVLSDNGAQIDLMFAQKEWYIDNNWTRDITEMYPHIVYISPKNMYTISHKDDFYKFILYGSDPNVTFVVIDNRDAKDNSDEEILIDCGGWNQTLGLVRARIVGATNKNGFKNLKVPLFSTLSGNTVSTLKFKSCTAPLAQASVSESFRYLTYVDCNFGVSTSGNIGGITQTVSGKDTKFESISYSGCSLSKSDVNNAGLLFGASSSNVGDVSINGIEILKPQDDKQVLQITQNFKGSNSETVNYGILFGSTVGNVFVSSLKMYDYLSVKFENSTASGNSESATDSNYTANVGIIGGYAHNITLNMQDIKLTNSKGLEVGVSNEIQCNLTLNAGGILGRAETISLITSKNIASEETETILKNITYAPNMNVTGTESVNNLYLGTVCGSAEEIQAYDAVFVFGKTENDDKKTVFKEINYEYAKSNTNVGGIAGSVKYICANTTDGIKPNGVIAYYGDLVAKKSTTKTAKSSKANSSQQYLNMGGIVGSINGASIISNVLFDGTISFSTDFYSEESANDNLYMRIGGIVGYISGDGATIKNVVASGEILLSNSEGKVVKLSDNQYVAGLIGYNDAKNTTLGTANTVNGENVEVQTGENVIVITTIFSLSGASGVDSIAHTGVDKKITLNNKVKYCSALNLVVSNLADEDLSYTTNNENETLYDWLVNDEYSNMGNAGDEMNANSVWIGVQNNTVKGSKLDPIIVNPGNESSLIETLENTDGLTKYSGKNDKNTYSYRVTENKKGGEIVTFNSTYNRKLYISISGESQLQNQISLKNTIMFSQGAKLISTFTPINRISEDSAVTGLVAQIYINEIDKDEKSNTNKYYNFGGLANVNNGIIYTCSVQEPLKIENAASTNFFGLIESKVTKDDFEKSTKMKDTDDDFNGLIFDKSGNGRYKLPVGVGGFVSYNTGYIFGSNSNVHMLTTQEIVTSNFVVSNKGTISYCYSTGLSENTSTYTYTSIKYDDIKYNKIESTFGNGYLFVADPTYNKNISNPKTSDSDQNKNIPDLTCGIIENCYTITKSLAVSTNTYLPSGVCTESDAVEKSGLSNITTLYKATSDNSALLDNDKFGYYACDPYCNYNYPTISGGAFKNFTFTKRSTMVEYDSEGGYYKEKNKTNTSDEDYKHDLYFQIPNLTVLKDLDSSTTTDGETTLNGLTTKYSKFVIISDINAGYNGTAIDKTIIKTLKPQVGESSISSDVYPVIIDGQGSKLKNLYFDYGVQFIQTIGDAGNGTSVGVTIKNITFDSLKLSGVAGLIGVTAANTIIDGVTFVNDSKAYIVTSAINSGQATNSSPNNNIGILVGTNAGTIQNCNFNSLITTSGDAKSSYSLGGLVGWNTGTVTDCIFGGSVYIKELFNDSSEVDPKVIFGGLIAVNEGTLKTSRLNVGVGDINQYYLTSGGTIYSSKDYGELTIEQKEKDPIPDGNYQLSAQIYVKTSNKAIVGGLVGEMQSGTISQCLTYKNSNSKDYAILVGDEYDQKIAYAGGIVGIMLGGTIKDCSNRSNVMAMATWLFTTKEKSGNPYLGNYKVAQTNGIAERGENQTNSYSDRVYYEDANEDYTFYREKKDEGAYARVYVYREMTSLAYAGGIAGAGLKTAKAEAGATEGNVRLANFGSISGGFRAVKPVAIIQNSSFSKDDASNKVTKLTVSFLVANAAIIAYAAASKIVGPWGAVAAAIAAGVAVGATRSYWFALQDLKAFATMPSVVIEGISGCSTNYYKETNFVNNLLNNSNNSDVFKDVFNKDAVNKFNKSLGVVEYPVSNWSVDLIEFAIENWNIGHASGYKLMGGFIYTYNEVEKIYNAFNFHNLTAYKELNPISRIKALGLDYISPMYTLQSISVKEQLNKINRYENVSQELINVEITIAEGNVNEYRKDDNRVEQNFNKVETVKLTSYAYDGICPALGGENLQVYSSTTNTKETTISVNTKVDGGEDITTKVNAYTLNTGNPDNATIAFKNEVDKKYSTAYDQGIPDPSDWTNDKGNYRYHWTSADNGTTIIPMSPNDLTVNSGSITGDKETGFYYTLSEAKDWEKIVYTINNDSENNYKDNMHIRVDLKMGEKAIPVGNNTLNEFNGTITFNSSKYYFTNLVLSNSEDNPNEGNPNIGLIKHTNDVSLYNINIKGSIKFSTSKEKGNAGILIGSFGESTKKSTEESPVESTKKSLILDNIRIQPSSIIITEDVLVNVSNLGGLIGKVYLGEKENIESEETTNYNIKISDISIGSYDDKTFDINVEQIAEDSKVSEDSAKVFGGVVGLVEGSTNSEELLFDNIAIYGTVKMVSRFSIAGGFVGKIDGATVNFGISDNDKDNDDEKTDKTSVMQLNLGMASNFNTYVGGIVGENNGSINVNSGLSIGGKKGIVISSDVINGNKNAYAGGVVGYNTGDINDSGITIGNNPNPGYSNINYILAGFNGSNLSKYAIPNEANASFGCGNGGVWNPKNNGTIAKYLYAEKEYKESGATIFPEWNFIKINDEGEIDNSNAVTVTDRFKTKKGDKKEGEESYNYLTSYEKIVSSQTIDVDGGGSVSSTLNGTYTTKNGLAETKVITPGDTIFERTCKIGYKFTPIEFKAFTTSHPDDVVLKQYKMIVNYKEYSKQYDIETANVDIEYEFNISLIGLNAKVEDTGRYMLIITQLNDYEFTEKELGIIKWTISVNDEEQKDKNISDTDITQTVYEPITYDTPKMLGSKIFNLQDISESTTLFTLTDLFDFSLKYSSTTEDRSQKTGIVTSENISATFKNESLSFAIEKDKGDNKYKFNIYDTSIENVDTFTTTSEINKDNANEDNLNNDNNKYSTSQTSTSNKYKIELLSVDLNSNALNALSGNNGVISLSGYRYNKYCVNINSEEIVKKKYTENLSINGALSIDYQAPSFTYSGNNYNNIYVYKYNNSIKNNDYIIVSCAEFKDTIAVTEYIYRIDSTSDSNPVLKYCGYISYNIEPQSVYNNVLGMNEPQPAKNFYDAIFNPGENGEPTEAPERYESFFPVQDYAITDTQSDIVDFGKETDGEISFYLNYRYATISINNLIGGNTSCDYEIKYEEKKVKYKSTLTKTNDLTFEPEGPITNSTTISTSSGTIYATANVYNGLLATKGLDATNSLVEVKVGAPSKDDLTATFDEDSEEIVEYYKYKGTIIGIKTQYKYTEQEKVVDKDGNETYKDVEKTEDRYYIVNENRIDGTWLSKKADIKFYVFTGEYDASKLDIK